MTPAANRPRRGSLPMGIRLWLGLGFVLAVAATVVAALSVNTAWLRLAVLLGVWAALIAAFALTWSRRDVRAAELRIEESKLTYQLELQREVSARREFEIAVSQTAREEIENRHREELAGLREQLDRLNSTLSGLLDGDLLFERLTLSAESTRVRQVGDGGRNRFAGTARPVQLDGGPEVVAPIWSINEVEPKAALASPPDAIAGDAPQKTAVEFHPERDDDTIQFPRNMFGTAQPTAPAEAVDGGPEHQNGAALPAALPDSAVIGPEPEPAAAEPDAGSEVESFEVAGPSPVEEPEPTSEPGEPDSEPIEVAAEEQDAAAAPPIQPESDAVAAQDEDEAGHSAGISVADLLAAYGAAEGAPRRRRRAAD